MDIAFLRSLDMAAPKLVQDPDLLPEDAGVSENVLDIYGRSLEAAEAADDAGPTEAELDQQKEDIMYEELRIAVIFIALLIGGFTKLCTKKTHLPFTPVLTVLGILIASVDFYFYRKDQKQYPDIELEKESVLRRASDAFHFPEPKLIFLLFLPALIFESAFNSDWYTFKRQFLKILVMATIVLVFSTFATAASMFFCLGFDSETNNMSFMGCLLFGCINSATDPVAVVALLKELGVSKRLSTLIEGESLLNDGTALVLFIALQYIEEGEDMSAGKLIGMFGQMSLGGPLLGLAFGMLMSFTLSRVHNEPIIEANLTLCIPYILFYVSEHPKVHVSGILALVACGLYMTNRGRTHISTESEEAIHHVWHYFGFAAETLIFLLTGYVLGGTFYSFQWIWLAQLLGLYVFLHIIRFLGIFLSMPLLNVSGYKLDIKQVILLSYSGLRGAVGLCLALIVKFNPKISDPIREQIMFFTAGIVLLTLIVNATTTGFVIKKLGLAKENEMAKRMLAKVLDEHETKAHQFIQHWKKDRIEHGDRGGGLYYQKGGKIDFDQLQEFKRALDKYVELRDIRLKYPELEDMKANDSTASARGQDRPKAAFAERAKTITMSRYARGPRAQAASPEQTRRENKKQIRTRYLLEVKAAYMEHYEEGLVSPDSLIQLLNSINEALDHADEDLYDWSVLADLYRHDGCLYRTGMRLQAWPCIGSIIEKAVFAHVRMIYDVYQNFIVCSNTALELLDHCKTAIIEDQVNDVKKEVVHNLEEARHRIMSLRSGNPSAIKQVDLQHCEYYVLKQFTKYYAHMAHTGELDSKHHDLIQEELDRKIAKLKLKLTIRPLSLEQVLAASTLKKLFGQELAQKSLHKHGILVQPAHLITNDGHTHSVPDLCLHKTQLHVPATNNKVYLITKGAVYEHLKKDLSIENIDPRFAGDNKQMRPTFKRQVTSKQEKRNRMKRTLSLMAHKQIHAPVKETNYSRKITAGKVIGLQNVLPHFQDHAETVFFTDNHMVGQLYEVDVAALRQRLGESRSTVAELWELILPSSLLLLHKQGMLPLPKALDEMHWKEAWQLLHEFTELKVLDINEEIQLPNGGFLLQGSIEQIIHDERVNQPQPDAAGLRRQVTVKVQEVKDRVTFSAFTVIRPEDDELKDLPDKDKKSVLYNANTKFTVILAAHEQLKELWRDGAGELKIERLMDQQRRLTRMKTIHQKLVRQNTMMCQPDRLTHKVSQPPNLAHNMSMRLIPLNEKRQMVPFGSVRVNHDVDLNVDVNKKQGNFQRSDSIHEFDLRQDEALQASNHHIHMAKNDEILQPGGDFKSEMLRESDDEVNDSDASDDVRSPPATNYKSEIGKTKTKINIDVGVVIPAKSQQSSLLPDINVKIGHG